MKAFLKWTGIVLGSLLLIVAIAVAYLNASAKSRLARHYDIQPPAVAIPNDSASIAEGGKWVNSLCASCHGENLAGAKFFDAPELGTICSANLSPGLGGIGKKYTDLDWVRAIRHGVNREGRPLLGMPAENFQYLSDEHLGQIIAYLKTLPPVDQQWPAANTTLFCNVLFALGAFGEEALPAESIDHRSPAHFAPPRAATAEYGKYIVQVGGCRACHGPQLNGGPHPDPAGPISPNLTPGGALPSWGAAGFVEVLRSGVTPAGKELNGKYMPWKGIGRLDDDQLQAIYAYLMAQPGLATAVVKK